MPAAAPTFSITMFSPKRSPMRCAWMRALTSTPPPAANGTTRVNGRVGQSCARAAPGAVRRTPISMPIPALAFALAIVVSSSTLPLVDHDAARLDRARPFLDLARHEFAEVIARASLGRHDVGADLGEPLPDDGRVQGLDRRRIELAHDRIGSALGQEDRIPGIGVESRKPLLLRGRQIGQERRALFGRY